MAGVSSRKPELQEDRASETPLGKLSDFPLMSGGALYQLLRRARLSGDGLELAHRRVLAVVLLTWVPLLLLSVAEGNAWGDGVALTFLKDVETHLRMLIAAPLLILAEVVAHRRLTPIVRLFVENGLIPDEARPRFDAALASALRLRGSILAELGLIAFVYGVGMPFVWRDQMTLGVDSTWYAATVDGRLQPSYAGLWLGLVSIAVFQLLALRWYFRFFIWARFLWQVSRLPLNLEPTHPDGTAGLLFLARSARAYMLVPLAIGTGLSGMIANRIFYTGATLLEFKQEIAGTAAVMLLLVLGPLIVFEPQLRTTRRKGMIEYGTLGQAYAREFDRKWLSGPRPANESLLGSPDLQSLADLRNGFQNIRGIRLVPFTKTNAAFLAAITVLPIAPLLLTMFSPEQLLQWVLKTLL